jgi:NitT/TauT family transport system substrate-binding protein
MALIRRRSSLLALPALALSGALRAQPRMSAVTQLGWLRNGEFAPILVAEAHGYFAAEGIAHRIVDGGPGRNPIPIVAVGQATFGLATSGLYLVAARTARDPVDVVAVGALYQSSPAGFLRIANPGDREPTPRDLEGRIVGVQAGGEYFVSAMARRNGVDESKRTVVNVQANADPLIVGRVDFFSGWITNQTYQIEQEAAKPDAPPTVKGRIWQVLRYSNWGLPSYADVIFTTPKIIQENPDLVAGYLRAVARGMQFILDHPEDAVDVVAHQPGQIEDAAKLTWRWKVQNPLFTSADTASNGLLWMNPATWTQMVSFLKEVNEIPHLIAADSVMNGRFAPGRLPG